MEENKGNIKTVKLENGESVKMVKIEDGDTYETFVKSNGEMFWKFIIEAIEKLAESKHLDNMTAFIIYGDKLDNNQEIIVQRNGIDEIIENALNEMESLEEYELCNKLVKLSEEF